MLEKSLSLYSNHDIFGIYALVMLQYRSRTSLLLHKSQVKLRTSVDILAYRMAQIFDGGKF